MADIQNKKSSVVFNLTFTTSKLLAYIIVIISGVVGYLLASAEIVTVGFMIGGALSGAKSVSDNIKKMKIEPLSKINSSENDKESEPEIKNKKDILL